MEEAFMVLKEKGPDAFIEYLFTGKNCKKLSYAEMRSIYG
jgi:hypothetical protein